MDVKVLLRLKRFDDVLGLAETFLKKEKEVSMIGMSSMAGIDMVISKLVEAWECWYMESRVRESREGGTGVG